MISEWGIHFYQLLDNQERYREMDAASRLSASNRSIHPLTRSSDRSLRAYRRPLKCAGIGEGGRLFHPNATTSGDMEERTLPVD